MNTSSKKTLKVGSLSWLLLPLVLLGPISMDMYLPAMPNLQQDMGIGALSLQWTLSIFVLGFGLSQIAIAIIVNYLGTLRTLLMASIAYIITTFLLSINFNINEFISLRFLQAFFSCMTLVLSMGLVRKVLEDPRSLETAYSTLTGATSLAPICSPILGAILLHFFVSWRVCFIFMSLFALISLHSVWRLRLKINLQTEEPTHLSHLFFKYRQVLQNRIFWRYVMIGSSSMAMLFCYFSMAPILLIQHFKLNSIQFSATFALGAMSFLISSLSVSRVLESYNFDFLAMPLLLALFFISIFMLPLAVHYDSLLCLIIIIMVMNAVLGMMMGPAMSAAMMPFKSLANEAASVYGFVQFIFSFVVSTSYLAVFPIDIMHLGWFIVMLSLWMMTCVRPKLLLSLRRA